VAAAREHLGAKSVQAANLDALWREHERAIRRGIPTIGL
jgi:hypothetical protein